MIGIVRVTATILSFILFVIFIMKYNISDLKVEHFSAYHVAEDDRQYDYDLYLQDNQRNIRINLSHLRCSKALLPEAPSYTTGRFLEVSVRKNRLVIMDVMWKLQCEL